ncbi:hypothetical protein FOA52_012585 [Chlamydomonas sp. UWO 241]|nr:hypothetical protein FOA52_012585 [Chlamydomonas sp. UWO 241]
MDSAAQGSIAAGVAAGSSSSAAAAAVVLSTEGEGLPALPPDVWAQIFSNLPASQLSAAWLGRAASVCSEWRAAIAQEATLWEAAMRELDPFDAVGGAEGARALFDAAGSWLRVAAALTGCMQPGCKCGPHWVGTDDSCLILCRCVPGNEREAAAAAEASSTTGAFRLSCDRHCARSEGCFPLKSGRVLNRWVFAEDSNDAIRAEGGRPLSFFSGYRRPLDFLEYESDSEWPKHDDVLLEEDEPLPWDRAEALRKAVDNARPFATILISGELDVRSHCA